MIIKYVCNCCGEKDIDPRAMLQHEPNGSNRIYHQCIKCVSARLTFGDFRALNVFDIIFGHEYQFIVEETAKALKNKDWARQREIGIYKAKYSFSADERYYFNSDVKALL